MKKHFFKNFCIFAFGKLVQDNFCQPGFFKNKKSDIFGFIRKAPEIFSGASQISFA